MAKIKAKLKEWLGRKTEDCKTISPLFSYSYDRKLSLIERLRVRLHLFTCGACLNYVSNLKFMHEVFHRQEDNFEQEKIHASLSPEAKERIKQKLKAQNL
jgi:hypothetical protein